MFAHRQGTRRSDCDEADNAVRERLHTRPSMDVGANEQSIFSADLPRSWLATPPGDAPIASVRDILLATNDPNVNAEDLDRYPPVLMPTFPRGPAGAAEGPAPIDLGFGVSMLRFERDQTERVMNACFPRGHYFHPVRQYGQRYTFVNPVTREDWEQHLFRWDPDGALNEVLAMSRLIIDHGYSTEFAARIIEHEDGEQIVMPILEPRPVYRLQHTRDWMTAGEVEDLRQLIAAFRLRRETLPSRVTRALWNVDYGTTVRWLDIRLPLLVIGFEGLISTSTDLVRRQFYERVPKLAADAGVEGITASLCKELYDARSRWAHGSHIALKRATKTEPEQDEDHVPDRQTQKVALLEHALRQVVRLCIQDDGFASRFQAPGGVRQHWPVQI